MGRGVPPARGSTGGTALTDRLEGDSLKRTGRGQTYSDGNMRWSVNLRVERRRKGRGEGVPKGARGVLVRRVDTLSETVKIAVPHVEEVSVIWQKRD